MYRRGRDIPTVGPGVGVRGRGRRQSNIVARSRLTFRSAEIRSGITPNM